MAEELGEVRVRIEEEGAEEAADTIGDAVGEGMADGDQQGAAGGGQGGMLAGISAKLAGILAAVGFLASLKPIQELLSGIQRLFSVAIVPLVALLTAFLRPILQKFLRLLTEFDLTSINSIIQSGIQVVESVLNDILNRISSSIKQAFPDIPGLDTVGRTAATSLVPGLEEFKTLEAGADFISGQFDQSGSGGNALQNFVNVTGFLEQSNTSLTSNAADSNAEVNQRETAGSQ